MKVYHVDEYCEGASSFYFSERKDVVLFEDYEKLREENERLKSELEVAKENAMDFCWTKTLDNLRKENAKLECLALHAMSEYFYLKAETYTDTEAGKYIKVMMLATKSREAYRKAKKALREGK